MQKKSVFAQVLIVIAISVTCILITAALAFLFGSIDTAIFDFKNLNIANMIPVILVGGFISCVIIGISILVVSKNSFLKLKDYLSEINNDRRNEK